MYCVWSSVDLKASATPKTAGAKHTATINGEVSTPVRASQSHYAKHSDLQVVRLRAIQSAPLRTVECDQHIEVTRALLSKCDEWLVLG